MTSTSSVPGKQYVELNRFIPYLCRASQSNGRGFRVTCESVPTHRRKHLVELLNMYIFPNDRVMAEDFFTFLKTNSGIECRHNFIRQEEFISVFDGQKYHFWIFINKNSCTDIFNTYLARKQKCDNKENPMSTIREIQETSDLKSPVSSEKPLKKPEIQKSPETSSSDSETDSDYEQEYKPPKKISKFIKCRGSLCLSKVPRVERKNFQW